MTRNAIPASPGAGSRDSGILPPPMPRPRRKARIPPPPPTLRSARGDVAGVCRFDSVEVEIGENFGAKVRRMLREECTSLADTLEAKNRAYGNAAFDPIRIFSRLDAEAGIRVRLDDKLSRLARGETAGEDTELDLMGYIVLLRVARRLKAEP